VAHQTAEAPSIDVPPDPPPRADSGTARGTGTEVLRALAWRYRWVLAAVGLLAISTVIVLAARVRPGYDPYGWLVWGKLSLHWKLETDGAPSWKPLPYLFTLPFSLVGHYALWLWMITAVAVSLSGAMFAWRIAFRLVDAAPERRYAAYAAGAVAAIGVLGIRDYTHFYLSSQSDPMIVALCLAAIDCYLCGRLRWAFWLWVLGGLGRPEVWPFLGLYTIWLWRRDPTQRRMIIAGIVAIPLLWFGIPGLTARSPFVAGDNALKSVRALHENKIWGTIDRFLDLHELPIWLASLAGVAFAAVRRQRFVLILAGGALLWVLVEVAFVLHGWPGVPRYLFEPVAIACVLAGYAVGRVILDLPPLLSRVAPRASPSVVGWATGIVVLVFLATWAPGARSRLRLEKTDLVHERARAHELGRLSAVITRLGGIERIRSCGTPNVPIGYQSVFAWYTGSDVGSLYITKKKFALHPHPLVTFHPLHNGWAVVPSHLTTAAQRARCQGIRITYRS
jgi:hypothetical protein